MSTPVTPAPVTSATIAPITITTAPAAAQTFLQKHERLLIVLLILLSATWLGNRWLGVIAARDGQAANTAALQVTQQKSKDAALAAEVTQLNGQYQAVVSQLSAQNAKLATAIANRNVTLVEQQTTDKTLPLPELDNRWSSLAGFSPTELTATSSGVTVSDTGARQTVEQLEKVPVLTSNLKDETTVADNRQQELDKSNLLVGGLNNQVSALNLTVSEQDKACKEENSSLKASARKGKLNWFLRGLVIGGGIVTAVVFHI